MWPFRGKNKGDKGNKSEVNGEAETAKADKKDKKAAKKNSASSKNNNVESNVSIINLSDQLNVAEEAQAQLR